MKLRKLRVAKEFDDRRSHNLQEKIYKNRPRRILVSSRDRMHIYELEHQQIIDTMNLVAVEHLIRI